MTYDDERPASWTTYDRVATAAAELRWLLFEMRAGDHQERMLAVLGPANYQRAQEYLDCITANLTKMGALGLGWAQRAMDSALEGRDGGGAEADAKLAMEVAAAIESGDINTAWNLVEAWAKR